MLGFFVGLGDGKSVGTNVGRGDGKFVVGNKVGLLGVCVGLRQKADTQNINKFNCII